MDIRPADPTCITKFFSANTRERFIIPIYQRRYAWQKKQVQELINDIRFLRDGEQHFLSNVLFRKDHDDGSGFDNSEVIDGQQRLTTLVILLSIVKNKMEQSKSKNKFIKEISTLEGCLHAEWVDDKRERLTLSEIDRGDLTSLLSGDIDNTQNANLREAYTEIDNWIGKCDDAELKRIYNLLDINVKIMRLNVC